MSIRDSNSGKKDSGKWIVWGGGIQGFSIREIVQVLIFSGGTIQLENFQYLLKNQM